jgi:hypothetical protein
MPHTFENSAIQIEVNPGLARWSASGKQRNSPSLENCQFSLKYKRGIIGGRLLALMVHCAKSTSTSVQRKMTYIV